MSFELLAPRCATCRLPLGAEGSVVNHGDMVFHRACAPSCSVCNRRLSPLDAAWRCEAEVVSEAWGYALRPIRLWCAECWGSAPRAEPTALD